jgi:hypothetical protein
MIEETINKIEERLRTAENLTPVQRRELETLLQELRGEVATLPERSPAPNESEAEDLLARLRESVTEFETSHPRLIEITNRMSNILANFGI